MADSQILKIHKRLGLFVVVSIFFLIFAASNNKNNKSYG